MASTREILDHHLLCFVGLDLDGIMADYTPDAILFTPSGTLKGPAAIRAMFQDLFAEFSKPGFSAAMEGQFVESEYAYICGMLNPRKKHTKPRQTPLSFAAEKSSRSPSPLKLGRRRDKLSRRRSTLCRQHDDPPSKRRRLP